MSRFDGSITKFLNNEATKDELFSSLESLAPLSEHGLNSVLATLENLSHSGELDEKIHRDLRAAAIRLLAQDSNQDGDASKNEDPDAKEFDDKTVFREGPQTGAALSPPIDSPVNSESAGASPSPSDSEVRSATQNTDSSLNADSFSAQAGGKVSRTTAWPTGGFSNELSVVPTEGAVIKNRFVLEKLIASGGMGMVFKARDLIKEEAQERNPYVALKVLNDSFKQHPEAYLALSREARKTQELAHPNIVNVFDFDRDNETVFMTMELLDGQGLDQALKAKKKRGFPVEQALDFISQMSAALIHAHSKGVLHCDFKPNNVFLVGGDSIKVLDFGIAQANRTSSDEPVEQTRFDAKSLGALTVGYASREVHEGLDPEPSDDVFALACVAYQLFVGEHPYKNKPANTLLDGPEKLPTPDGLTRKQWKALQKGLAIRREDRTQSVEEFIEGLNPESTPQINLKFAAAIVTGIAVVGLAYAVPVWMNQNRINNLAAEFLSEDLERMSAAVVTLSSFSESSRLQLLDRIESEFISLFNDMSRQIDDTAEAERFLPYLGQARTLYPESLTLSESENYLSSLRDLEISNFIADFSYALENNLLISASGPGNIEELLVEVERLDPQSPLLSDRRLLLNVQQQALLNAEGGDFDTARRLVNFGLQRFPDNVSLIDTSDLVEMLATNTSIRLVNNAEASSATAQGQEQASLDALLETPEFTSAWDSQVVELRNSMLENRTLSSAEFEALNTRVGNLYVDQVSAAIETSRFNEASRLIISGRTFAPELNWQQQESLLADAREESIRVAEIDGLRYTVEAQLNAMQLSEAAESLRLLQDRQVDPDDPFLNVSYIDLVERSRLLGDNQAARNYLNAGLAYLPSSEGLLDLQRDLRLLEVRQLITAYFVDQTGDENDTAQLLLEARSLSPDDHSDFIAELGTSISETLTRLDGTMATDWLERTKVLLPELGDSLDQFVQSDENLRIETLVATAREYLIDGSIESSIENYQLVLAINPEHVMVRELLIEVSDAILELASDLYDDAQYREAIEVIDDGIAMQPPNQRTLERIRQDSQERLESPRRRQRVIPTF